MILAAISDSDAFQVLYPLLMVPVSAWYVARYTERRAERATSEGLLQAGGGAAARTRPPSGGRFSASAEARERGTTASDTGRGNRPATNASRTMESKEDPWALTALLIFSGLLAAYLIARGYAAARDTLVDVLLVGGGLGLGLSAGTFVGLLRLPTFTASRRVGLIVAALAQAVGVGNAYFLIHPSWTRGDYQQVFERFLDGSRTLEQAFGEQLDATFFLAYQGLGALMTVLCLVVSVVCVLAISGETEATAGGRIGWVRRGATWVLRGPNRMRVMATCGEVRSHGQASCR